jgi:SNF2 family DNA or RNA helicase
MIRYNLTRRIVAPLAVMEQWATEASTKTVPGRLKVTTHHGPSRTKCAWPVMFSLIPAGKTLEKFDLVITTFQTLASEFKTYEEGNKVNVSDDDSDSDSVAKKITKKKGKKASHALFDVKWLRVVIGESRLLLPLTVDEAQNIKNRKTNAAKAATALRAKYRWCLTG